MKKSEEEFPIASEQLDRFIKVNTDLWGNSNSGKDGIIVNFSMVRMQVAWIIPKLLYAKGLAETTGANVYVISWRKNQELTELFESFGFKHIVLNQMMLKNPIYVVKAFMKTMFFIIKDGTGEGLKKLKMKGVSAGKSIYEDILRTSNLSTLKNARNIICFKKMSHILCAAYILNAFCKRKNVRWAIIDDIAYHEGLFIKLFLRQNIEIWQMNNWRERKVQAAENGNIETTSSYLRSIIVKNLDKVEDSIAVQWTDNYLQERFKGNNGRNIDRGAFKGKKVFEKSELQALLNLNPNKKNVVIMAHTFTDAVFNYGEFYFRDYYDWTEKTLQLATEIEDVNWILKPHPTRKAYNENEDSIEKMYEKYKTKNISILTDEISGESIKNLADVIITIGGNAGAEFSCFGIPTVIVGKPYYQGFQYTIEPSDYDEYKKTLINIACIEKLNDKQILTAKKVFYLRNNESLDYMFSYFHDDFSDYINKKYEHMMNKIALQYFAGNQGTEEYNDEILGDIITYFEKEDMRDCRYYKAGKGII